MAACVRCGWVYLKGHIPQEIPQVLKSERENHVCFSRKPVLLFLNVRKSSIMWAEQLGYGISASGPASWLKFTTVSQQDFEVRSLKSVHRSLTVGLNKQMLRVRWCWSSEQAMMQTVYSSATVLLVYLSTRNGCLSLTYCN